MQKEGIVMTKTKEKLFEIINILIVVLVLSGAFFPFGYALIRSRGGWSELFLWSPLFLRTYFNNLLSSIIITVVNLSLSIPAAYYFRRMRFKHKNLLYFAYIVMLIIPYQAMMLPEYILSKELGMIDTLIAVIIPSAATPLSVIIITQLFRTIPEEQIEAFRLESNSELKSLLYIAIPHARKGIVCCAVIVFSQAWNMIERPRTLLTGESILLLQQYISDMPAGAAMFAAVIVVAIIPLILFIYAEENLRQFVISDITKPTE